MLFGLTNVPTTFYALINITLPEYLDIFITAYFNDILIYIKRSLKEQIKLVEKIFKVLQKTDISLQTDKCKFYIKEIKFLELVVITNRIQIDEKKIKAVKK